MQLIEPIARNYSVLLFNSTKAPCGGSPKGKTHLLSSPGGQTVIQWQINEISENGYCKIRISEGIPKVNDLKELMKNNILSHYFLKMGIQSQMEAFNAGGLEH